jgi:hypothetical protein
VLESARERISAVDSGKKRTFQGDFRKIDLPQQGSNVILAAAVLPLLVQSKPNRQANQPTRKLVADLRL